MLVLIPRAGCGIGGRGRTLADPGSAVPRRETARNRRDVTRSRPSRAVRHRFSAPTTRLLRTQQTIDIALDGQRVPTLIEPGFDKLHAGDLEGAQIQAYRSWRNHHTSSDRLPHGESIDDAPQRYARATPPPGEERNGHARRRPRTRTAMPHHGRPNRLIARHRHGRPERSSVPI